jgi:hypothetical protein
LLLSVCHRQFGLIRFGPVQSGPVRSGQVRNTYSTIALSIVAGLGGSGGGGKNVPCQNTVIRILPIPARDQRMKMEICSNDSTYVLLLKVHTTLNERHSGCNNTMVKLTSRQPTAYWRAVTSYSSSMVVVRPPPIRSNLHRLRDM